MEDRQKDIHTWFELSYAQYFVIPRSILQSMPAKWQHKFVGLLEVLDNTFDWRRSGIFVRLMDRDGFTLPDELGDYERGRRTLSPEDVKAIAERHEKRYNEGVKQKDKATEDILTFRKGAEHGMAHVQAQAESEIDEAIERIKSSSIAETEKLYRIRGMEEAQKILANVDDEYLME